ncbi:hypothetical protein GQ53DRAFT_765462 [Thozetella sp. PMI_491]|nr:hypothetical protein GQ53DRAFT_765462 [Thozetella sp. PMI_491]
MTDIRHILTDESDEPTSRPRYRTPESQGSRGLPSPILQQDERPDLSRGSFGVGHRGGYVATERPPPLALWAVPDDTPPPSVTPQRPWSLGPSQPSGTKRAGPSEPSAAQAPKRRREEEFEPVMPLTPPMPPFLTQPPEICKHAPVSNIVGDKAKFSWGMKLITLTTSSTLQIWAEQVEAIARESHCLEELTTRFTTFPTTGTVDAMVCKARFSACWSILRDTISGPVWAYMRVLGYRKIPVFKGHDGFQWQPTPYDCYYFAKEASKRMDNPGSASQSRHEIMNMVDEAQTATPADYTSQRQYAKGKDWIMAILNKMIRDGDREVCEALYDTKPAWAPEWPPTNTRIQLSPATGPLPMPTHRRGSAPEWSPVPPLPRLGSLTPPRPAPSNPFSPPRATTGAPYSQPGPIAAPSPPAMLPRPNSAPGSDHLPMPIPVPTHRRSNSGLEISPLPTPQTPILGSPLPPLQPRPDPSVKAESPTQQSPTLGPHLPLTPTFPSFHANLEWSPSLTQEKMRNATWKELNVKVPTASLASPQSSALRQILPSATRQPTKTTETRNEEAAGAAAVSKKPRKGYRFVHELRKVKSEPETDE